MMLCCFRGGRIVLRITLVIYAVLAMCWPVKAMAACINPAGSAGDILYNRDYDVFQGCTINNNWVGFNGLGGLGGSSVCASPAGDIGDILYNRSFDTFQGCTANKGWVAFYVPGNNQGLIHHWRLEETSGSYVDSAGGTSCTRSGTQSSVAGKDGNGVQFTAAYANCGDLADTHGLSTATLAAWMKRTAAGNMVLVGKEASSSNHFEVEFWSDGNTYFELGNPSETHGTYTLNDTAWHHIVLVFNGTLSGTARLKGYVDGNPVTLSYSGTPPATLTSNTNMFAIGKTDIQTSTGSVDDVRVYNRALSAAEVLALYKSVGGP